MALVMIYQLLKCRASSCTQPGLKQTSMSCFSGVTQVHRSRGREVFLDVFCKVSSSPVHQPSIYLFLLVCTHDVPDSQDHPTGEGVYFGLQFYEDTVHHEREGRVTRDQLVTLLQRSGTEREEDVGLSYKPTRSTTGNQLKTTCWGVWKWQSLSWESGNSKTTKAAQNQLVIFSFFSYPLKEWK